ncbi:MAG: MaoC family dehydratase N-terminal domain-containing protein [Dehalococcoidia bacterium]|nr:MaoC family dehydratase N-terminal domain-containing protein [Dehalococcoidia bacterium]
MTVDARTLQSPQIGDVFGPKEIHLDDTVVRDYVAATGDDTFWAHQERMRRDFGSLICPPTILDRELGTRLAALRYQNVYALHAKQSFHFKQPLLQGSTYFIDGVLTNIYERNGIKYFTITATATSSAGEKVVTSEYTRAFEFPNSRHPAKTTEPLTLSSFLESRDPSSGNTILRGSKQHLAQSLMNLYSGPGANIHTDMDAAAIRGHRVPIVQGLMALSIECRVFRDIHGAAWYTSGCIATRFIRPIRANSVLCAWERVNSSEQTSSSYSGGVFDEDGFAVTISEVSVS